MTERELTPEEIAHDWLRRVKDLVEDLRALGVTATVRLTVNGKPINTTSTLDDDE